MTGKAIVTRGFTLETFNRCAIDGTSFVVQAYVRGSRHDALTTSYSSVIAILKPGRKPAKKAVGTRIGSAGAYRVRVTPKKEML